MRKSSGGFFSKLTSNPQKAGRKACARPDISNKLSLQKVLGLTTTNRNGLVCNPVTGVIAYPAGCVIVLYDPKTNSQNHIFNPDKKTITCVCFSGDGKYLASGESGQQPLVRVWELNETLNQVAELKGHKSGIACVQFSPNQKLLVSIGDQHDMLVNAWNWKLCQTVASNKSGCRVRALSFAENGNYLVTVGNRHVKFWYMDTGCSTVKANAPTIPINGRNGILGDQKNNVFTDVMCGRGICAQYVYCVTKSGLLCVFNEKRIMEKWVELASGSTNCLVLTENLIFCGCSNGLIHVLDPLSLIFIAYLPRPHPLGVNVSDAISPSDLMVPSQNQTCPDLAALCLDEDHRHLTCVYNDHSIYIWDVHDVKRVGKVASFLYHSACIWGVEMYPYFEDNNQSLLPYGSFLTCSADDTVRIWNLDKGSTSSKIYPRNLYSNELLKTVYIDAALANLQDMSMVPSKKDDVKNGIRCMQISPNGQEIATGDRSGNLRIYGMEFFDELYRIEAHEAEILCVEYCTPDSGFSLLASSSRDRLIHIFDVLKSYELLQTIDEHSSSITAVRFNYDVDMLQLLSCGTDKVVMFHNAQVNDYGQVTFIRNTIVPGKATLYDMGVEPTRKFVATVGQDRNLRIYDIQQAKQLHCYKGSLSEEGNLIKFQFDGGGVYAAISCSDKTIGIYDFQSGACEATVYGHSELVTGLKFTAGGKNLVSVSGDGCIFVWTLPYQFSESIRLRMRELSLPLPPEEEEHNNVTERDARRETFVVNTGLSEPEEMFVSSEKWLNDNDAPRATLSGYRFSVGQLPGWAQKQMRPGDHSGAVVGGVSQPLGRWRDRACTETMAPVPEFIANRKMSCDGSLASSKSSENGCVSPGVPDPFVDSQIIYPAEDNQIIDGNRSFLVTENSHLKKADHFNDSLEHVGLNNHRHVDYLNADNPSDPELASDCLSGSPDGSDAESDSAGRNSPLMEHFERLGTPNQMQTYSSTSIDNGTSNEGRLSRSMSISAKFLSKSQLRVNRKISAGSCQSPDEQKRKLEALKEKFKLHSKTKKLKSKSFDKSKDIHRQNSIPDMYHEEPVRSGTQLKKSRMVSRSCQNLSIFASPSEFDSREFSHRNSSTPVYSKLGKKPDKQRRRTTEINNWNRNTEGTRIRRSDSANSEQFPVKLAKKVSPQIWRRGSASDTASKSVSSGTPGIVMRKPRSRTSRPKSMYVQSTTTNDFDGQIKNNCHSDDEGENLFSKMKHAFKPNKQTPSSRFKDSPSQAFKHSPAHSPSQSKSMTDSYKKAKISTHSKSLDVDTFIKQNSQLSSQSMTTALPINTELKQSPLAAALDINNRIEGTDMHSDIVKDMDSSLYLSTDNPDRILGENADRILGVVNEIDNVIQAQNIQAQSIQAATTDLPPDGESNSMVINMLKTDSYLNCNQHQISRTPPERDVPIRANTPVSVHQIVSETTTSLVVEASDMEPISLDGVFNTNSIEGSMDDELSTAGIEVYRSQSQEVLNNLISSYNETAEFQAKVLAQPETDIQRQLLSLIAKTYESIEASISEQRKLIDRNLDMSSETRSVVESDGFKELAKVISPRDSTTEEKNTIDMIAVLDKYSKLLLDVVTSKKNRETLSE